MDPVNLVMLAAEPAPNGAVMLAFALLLVGGVIGAMVAAYVASVE